MFKFEDKGPKEEVIEKLKALALPDKVDPSKAPQLEAFKAFVIGEIGHSAGRGVTVAARFNNSDPSTRSFNCSVSVLYV